jgi:hypothetical protein
LATKLLCDLLTFPGKLHLELGELAKRSDACNAVVVLPAAMRRVAHAPGVSIHWTNIAVAVGGLATAGALLVSLFLLRQQMRSQGQARQDRHLDHASHISFWLTFQYADEATDSVYGSAEPVVNIRVHIANSSLQPAMSVLVMTGIRRDVWHDASIKDKAEYEEVVKEWSAVAIAPGDRQDFPISLSVPRSVAEIVADYQESAIIGECSFIDASGIGWIRTHTGTLIERRSAEWVSSMTLSLAERDEKHRNPAQADEENVPKRRRLLMRLGKWLMSIADR